MELTVKEFCDNLTRDNLAHWAAKYYDHPILSYVIKIEYGINPTTVHKWCKENCRGRYNVYNEYHTLFEFVEDAVAFKLRWM